MSTVQTTQSHMGIKYTTFCSKNKSQVTNVPVEKKICTYDLFKERFLYSPFLYCLSTPSCSLAEPSQEKTVIFVNVRYWNQLQCIGLLLNGFTKDRPTLDVS